MDGILPAVHDQERLRGLEAGALYQFRDWPNGDVPQVAAGVYSIWRGAQLVYVGMSGRSLTSEQIAAHRAADARGQGLFTRLSSHAAGRRSGDQFCVYVADRLVLPTLTREDIAAIASGKHTMDSHVRVFIHSELAYRYVECVDSAEARRLEAFARRGGLAAGAPFLNPDSRRK